MCCPVDSVVKGGSNAIDNSLELVEFRNPSPFDCFFSRETKTSRLFFAADIVINAQVPTASIPPSHKVDDRGLTEENQSRIHN